MPLDEAEGTILAHSIALPGGRLRKGTRLGLEEVGRLRDAGIERPIVAVLGSGDVDENEVAGRVAALLEVDGIAARAPFTGRANLHATGPGLLTVDAAKIDALNRDVPAVTVATLPQMQRVTEGMMVATVKVIHFAVDMAANGAAVSAVAGALRLHRPIIERADLIVTRLPGAPDKIAAVTERLGRLGVDHTLTEVPHETDALRRALEAGRAPLRLILTASATSDPADIGPAAVLAAGGRVDRFGMPVDPGNLLFLGALGSDHVIGLPGCARSPALNGADWVLERIVCGLPVTSEDIAGMGVGGLLGEIPTRPQPRDPKA
ncbi:hypothetical protein jaqu_01880 [Jannaschia aquimarina]|uniref:Uncharacterized protein n=1 Tax=Jannaschia aquimarina TaxID=935700 RepID=A0A0D1DDJ3_9RHOB|nr:hypothetical protein jaqu_01880 [Jannaschia aquimarina]SNS89584.1 molybdenum cofactor cytidylyltransferase [Jannaschia aquimarina]